jgi:hypothetical protein
MTKSKINKAEIEERIKEIKSTPRSLIGSDSGTGSPNDQHDIYEEISGERYAVYSFAGSNGSRCSVEDAERDTQGRIRWFPIAQREMRELRAELSRLQDLLRKAK